MTYGYDNGNGYGQQPSYYPAPPMPAPASTASTLLGRLATGFAAPVVIIELLKGVSYALMSSWGITHGLYDSSMRTVEIMLALVAALMLVLTLRVESVRTLTLRSGLMVGLVTTSTFIAIVQLLTVIGNSALASMK